jgi:hypothetical protein
VLTLCRTDDWFSTGRLQDVHDLLTRFPSLKTKDRPRIAILDTGLNTSHPDVQKIYKPKPEAREAKRVKGLWAPPDSDWDADEDTDGHGTHCTMVAHKVAPDADLFVLRVFKDRYHATSEHIVEACYLNNNVLC